MYLQYSYATTVGFFGLIYSCIYGFIHSLILWWMSKKQSSIMERHHTSYNYFFWLLISSILSFWGIFALYMIPHPYKISIVECINENGTKGKIALKENYIDFARDFNHPAYDIITIVVLGISLALLQTLLIKLFCKGSFKKVFMPVLMSHMAALTLCIVLLFITNKCCCG